MNRLTSAWLNRDLVQGRLRQGRAGISRVWARLRRDPVLEARMVADALQGAVQARYGRHLAQAEWRMRRIARGC
ncbi:MAG TPA: hypothetical protein VFH71_10180 [Rhodanobacteraceae bacterium]|nr:hypothetical protein [Rhodanobacteraceae bacterium]